MTAEPAPLRRVLDVECSLCGAHLDEEHVEPTGSGYACTFCGATQPERVARPSLELIEMRAEPGSLIGDVLREERERQGHPLAEVVDDIRIQEKYLRALENGDSLNAFPGAIYAKFFLREYAEYLGLDAASLVRDFQDAEGVPEPLSLPEARPDRLLRAPGRRATRFVAAVAALALVAIAVTSLAGRDSSPPAPTATTSTAPPSSAPTTTAVPPEHGLGAAPAVRSIHARVEVVTGRCWIGAIADGTQIAGVTYTAGQVVSLPARHELLLTLGNAAEVQLKVNGRPVSTGGLGAVVHLTFRLQHGRLVVQRA